MEITFGMRRRNAPPPRKTPIKSANKEEEGSSLPLAEGLGITFGAKIASATAFWKMGAGGAC